MTKHKNSKHSKKLHTRHVCCELHDHHSSAGFSKLLIFRDGHFLHTWQLSPTAHLMNAQALSISVIILHHRGAPWASVGSIVSQASGHRLCLECTGVRYSVVLNVNSKLHGRCVMLPACVHLYTIV